VQPQEMIVGAHHEPVASSNDKTSGIKGAGTSAGYSSSTLSEIVEAGRTATGDPFEPGE
jgi:hypothetical protein